MGYTHTIDITGDLSPSTWKIFLSEIKRILKALPEKTKYRFLDMERYEAWYFDNSGVSARSMGPGYFMTEGMGSPKVFGPHGTGRPILTDHAVSLNGDGSQGLAFESIYIGRTEWNREPLDRYVKTERRPYDLAVCAILLSLAHYFPGQVVVGSDGDTRDWEPAYALYRKVTGREVPATGVRQPEMVA